MPLNRKKPLKRSPMPPAATGLRRTSGIQQRAGRESLDARKNSPMKRVAMAVSRPKPKLTKAEKAPLLERSGGICEIGTSACGHIATDVCHRRGEKSGGRHGEAAELNDRLSNVLHGCRLCHRLATDYPKTALLNGWRLLEHADPLAERVNYRGRWVFLDNEGGVRDARTGDGLQDVG